jgi:hypothetical protein
MENERPDVGNSVAAIATTPGEGSLTEFAEGDENS